MGKSSKTQEADTPTEFQEQSPSSQKPSGALSESELMARDIKEGRLSGFVGSGTILTGETSFKTMLRVDGHLKGKIKSDEGTLIIGATGQVDADIFVGEAIVNGAVNGNICTTNKLTLGRAARVVGDIEAPRLVIEDGAILEGGCNMVKSIEAQEQRIAESQKQFSTSELTNKTEKATTSVETSPKKSSEQSKNNSTEVEPEKASEASAK